MRRISLLPLAIDGLAQDVLGRRFALEGHRGWRRLRAPGMWCASRRIATCPTL